MGIKNISRITKKDHSLRMALVFRLTIKILYEKEKMLHF